MNLMTSPSKEYGISRLSSRTTKKTEQFIVLPTVPAQSVSSDENGSSFGAQSSASFREGDVRRSVKGDDEDLVTTLQELIGPSPFRNSYVSQRIVQSYHPASGASVNGLDNSALITRDKPSLSLWQSFDPQKGFIGMEEREFQIEEEKRRAHREKEEARLERERVEREEEEKKLRDAALLARVAKLINRPRPNDMNAPPPNIPPPIAESSKEQHIAMGDRVQQPTPSVAETNAPPATAALASTVNHALGISIVSSTEVVKPKFSAVPESKIRMRLRNLNTFVVGNTNRKIMVAWNFVEARFQRSSTYKTVMTKDEKGLLYPKKMRALSLSNLTFLLCSSKIKIGHKELSKLFSKFEVTPSMILHARKIAALRVLLGPSNGAGIKQAAEIKEELEKLIGEQELLVILDDFREVVFPEDPIQREKEMKNIDKERETMVEKMLEEKKAGEAARLKAELRLLKSVNAYAEVMSEIQFVRSPFNFSKLLRLREVVEYCLKLVTEARKPKDVTVTFESVDLLGLDAFPKFLHEAIKRCIDKEVHPSSHATGGTAAVTDTSDAGADFSTVADAGTMSKRPDKQNSGSAQGELVITNGLIVGPKAPSFRYPRVEFWGPITVLQMIKETVSFCKGMNGCSYRDVAEMLQGYGAVRLQAWARRIRRCVPYSRARKKWFALFHKWKLNHFKAWAQFTLCVIEMRAACLRKIVAWRFYTNRVKRRREYFRITFWPFFVWRRWAGANRKATEKAFFLTTRVLPTYVKIRVYNAWKNFVGRKHGNRRRSLRHYRETLERNACSFMRFWFLWAHKQRQLRRLWYRDGVVKFQKQLFICKGTPFQIWYSYVYYQKVVKARAHILAKEFRNHLLPGRPCVAPTSTTVRRARAVEAKIKRELEGKIVKQHEESKKKKRHDDKHQAMAMALGKGSPTSTPQSRQKSIQRVPDSPEFQDAEFDEFGNLIEKEKFEWMLPKMTYDIDDDGSDREDVPDNISTVYSKHVETLIDPAGFADIVFLDDFVFNKVNNMYASFRYVETWALLETSMRFHRFGHRAFRNLRDNAIIRRNAHASQRAYYLKRLRYVFDGFLKWMFREVAGPGYSEHTVADHLRDEVRAQRLIRLARRRQLKQEVKDNVARNGGDDSDYSDLDCDDETMKKRKLKEARRTRKWAGNEDDDESVVGHSDPAIAAKTANENNAVAPGMDRLGSPIALKSRPASPADIEGDPAPVEEIVAVLKPFQKPDMLAEDRTNRQIDADLAMRMMKASKGFRGGLIESAAASDAISADVNTELAEKEEVVQEVLEAEAGFTTVAIMNEIKYVSKFKIHAAEIMLNVLVKIHREVVIAIMRSQTKVYFRSLRIPMLYRRSTSMRNRKKILNWLRICKRLQSLDRLAPFYRKRRTQWTIFNRWLKYVEKESVNPSPGMIEAVKRRRLLYPRFEQEMQSKGFQKLVYYNNKRLQQESSELFSLFLRWVQYTQEQEMFRLAEKAVLKRRRIRIMQKCFWVLKSGFANGAELKLMIARSYCYVLTQVESDIDQMLKRFFARRRTGLSYVMSNYNRRYAFLQRQAAKDELSFKKFTADFEDEVDRRMVTEQRVLTNSFEERGEQSFMDVLGPAHVRHSKIPEIMSRFDGKRFADPQNQQFVFPDEAEETEDRPHTPGPNHEHDWHVTETDIFGLPGGYKFHKLRLNFQAGLGIVGWQVNWCADNARDFDGPKRGKWHGAAMSIQELVVHKDDFVIGVEYYYEGTTIYGIRFKLFNGGWSHWAGGKASMSTMTLFLGVDAAAKQPFEDEYSPAGRDEAAHPAFPRSYVIGFCGVHNQFRASCMGLVVRKIKEQNVFSFHWVKDALEKADAENTDQNAQHSTHHAVEDESVPDSVFAGGSGVPPDESLTLPAIGGARGLRSGGDDDNASHNSYRSQNSHRSGSISSTATGVMELHPAAEDHARSMSEARAKMPLMSSEQQFFDIMRMRTVEVKVAEVRSQKFAKHLWTNREIRADPQLFKLTSCQVVSGLTKWLFNTLSKRLMDLNVKENAATDAIAVAHETHVKAEVLARRSAFIVGKVKYMETSPQIWTGKTMLSPLERAAKKAFIETTKNMLVEAARIQVKADETEVRAKALRKLGRSLLSRLQLSQFVVGNYRLKIAAARHKESLLELMDMEKVKHALCGTGEKNIGLPTHDLESIQNSLRNRKPPAPDENTLDKLVEAEVARERVRLAKLSTLALGNSLYANSIYDPQQGRSLVVSAHNTAISPLDFLEISSVQKPKKRVKAVNAPATYVSKTSLLQHNQPRTLSLSASTSRLPVVKSSMSSAAAATSTRAKMNPTTK